jgi:hypothetical protein
VCQNVSLGGQGVLVRGWECPLSASLNSRSASRLLSTLRPRSHAVAGRYPQQSGSPACVVVHAASQAPAFGGGLMRGGPPACAHTKKNTHGFCLGQRQRPSAVGESQGSVRRWAGSVRTPSLHITSIHCDHTCLRLRGPRFKVREGRPSAQMRGRGPCKRQGHHPRTPAASAQQPSLSTSHRSKTTDLRLSRCTGAGRWVCARAGLAG